MNYYRNTTMVSNELLDCHLKIINECELKVLLTIIRRTVGYADKRNPNKRVERAWISQKLFMLCTGNSGRCVSSAIDTLVRKNLIVVTDAKGRVLPSPKSRRGTLKLYYASRLRLDSNNKINKGFRPCHSVVKNSNTIKLKRIKLLCEQSSQGKERISDRQRLEQILKGSKYEK